MLMEPAAPLAAAGSPELRRFLTGLWAWMGGNRAWHADSRRYHDIAPGEDDR